MPHAFDVHAFAQLMSDSERLVAAALDHERALTSLVTLLDGHAETLPASDGSLEFAVVGQSAAGTPARVPIAGTELLVAIRDLCIAARAQRLLAESVLERLIGDVAREEEAVRTRPRVLVIDDSDDNRDLVALIAETAGLHAMTARNGLEAVIVAHYAQPRLVLMDLSMPVLGGLETARLLKSSASTRGLPLVALTARPEMCELPPFDALFRTVLRKPVAPERLVAEVQRVV